MQLLSLSLGLDLANQNNHRTKLKHGKRWPQ
jgi:hypothetical protein